MTSLTITETTKGKKKFLNGIPFWSFLLLFIITIPFRIIVFVLKLFGKRTNHIPVKDSKWISYDTFNGNEIERRIIAETGFDGWVKFYELRTTDNQIQEHLKGKIFGEFYCETNYGTFLRQFKNSDAWPVSYLVFIDKSDGSFRRLKKSKSSWPDWRYEFINDTDFNIITESVDTHTTILTVKINNTSS